MKMLLSLLCLFLLPAAAFAGSDVPPEGPPWKRDLPSAQKEALEQGKPVFLYFTKTY